MGKRSTFARRPMDAYATPYKAVLPLIPHIATAVYTFAEPCCGEGKLFVALKSFGFKCVYAGDVVDGLDALATNDYGNPDAIITNPPWTRSILHEMILHFQKIAPTWLLFDADWAHTKQAIPFLPQCSHIVAIGRVKWIEDSSHTGKDNCAWYRFDAHHNDGPRFFGQFIERAPEPKQEVFGI